MRSSRFPLRFRRLQPAWVAVPLLLLLAAVVLIAGSFAAAKWTDHTPPTFAGLKSAITCIPGPGGVRPASYHLRWKPATDNVTPSSKIVYLVYQARRAGGEDFSRPTYTTSPGATSFNTPPLSSSRTFYFVVRARDRAGNRDPNPAERRGVNLCL